MAPTLEHHFTVRAYFDGPNILNCGTVKGGPQRTVLNPQTNTSHLDVRLSFRTPEGHGIYVHYDGMMQVDEACLAAILNKDAKTTQYGDHELFSTPIMETSDESKKWIESSSWVAEGRWVVEDGKVAIEYEVYRVRPTKK
ncbi:hypothetical protein CB0940_11941 [Cercospora beticola]|uniref:Uncharacterized protein n=1 Tax=Cercospora beticola TaxID=122368 RepID=A0A2G5IDJ7_CERBT|nr:hypothetical protein CB0940_11941 [Cercospora beticola]PIB02849.1 hypothetical protein CB0940_11941 [Cercospora beticola]WPB04308.1 hypothetical protein RHO25_008954 [Cercospora beticola]